MIIDIGNFKQTGEYRMTVRRASDGKIRRRTKWRKNLITNRGIDAAMSKATATSGVPFRLVVGSGSAAPLPTDLVLQSFLAGATANSSVATSKNFTTVPYYLQKIITHTFGQGEVVGNVSEMGWALTSSTPNASTQLYNRSLVTNAAGEPTSVTVLADEYLTVEWRFRMYVPALIQGQMPVSIKGVNTMQDYELTPIAVNNNTGQLYSPGWGFQAGNGAENYFPQFYDNDSAQRSRLYVGVPARPDITASTPTGAVGNSYTNNATSASASAYTTGSKRRDALFRWNLSRGNVTGINCFMLDMYLGAFCLRFPTFTFDKTSNDQLDLTIRWGLDNT